MTGEFELSGKRVWIAGHRGMVGSALLRRLSREECTLLTATRAELDLTNQQAVEDWVAMNRPQAVVVAAAKVGGIRANMEQPAPFLYENLVIAANVIKAGAANGVEKLLYLGSSCIYPREAEQPIREEALLTGPLEPTNEGYAVAKIAGIKLCQAYRRQYGCDFISAIPTNLYGPGDNFHPQESHVPAGLLRRFHEAKIAGADETVVWGSGRPRREFMHVDDLADACIFLLRRYSGESPINVGMGRDIAIAEFAALVAETVGFGGRLVFDSSKPDGMARKLLDTSRLQGMGWTPSIALKEGLAAYYSWFLEAEELRSDTIPNMTAASGEAAGGPQ